MKSALLVTIVLVGKESLLCVKMATIIQVLVSEYFSKVTFFAGWWHYTPDSGLEVGLRYGKVM